MDKVRKTQQLSAGNTNNRRHIMKVESNLMTLVVEIQQKLSEIKQLFHVTENMLIILAKHALGQGLTEDECEDLIDFIPVEEEEEDEDVGKAPTSDENDDFVEETDSEEATE
jgi:hypothetical protein